MTAPAPGSATDGTGPPGISVSTSRNARYSSSQRPTAPGVQRRGRAYGQGRRIRWWYSGVENHMTQPKESWHTLSRALPPSQRGNALKGRAPRPANRRTTDTDRIKLHRHHLRLAGRDYTVVTPRPGTDVRFATNRCHETWHILSDLRGARFLGRLLWGMSYQRHPNTVVLIGAPFLDPNPFDAEPSDPIVFAPGASAPFGTPAARAIKRQMPSGPGHGTVRWHTPGLDQHTWPEWADSQEPDLYRDAADFSITRRNGVLVFSASPTILRMWAHQVHTMGFYGFPMDYEFLEGWRNNVGMAEGEVQIFAEYRHMVSRARTARREVFDAANGGEVRPRDIWERGDDIKWRVLGPPRSHTEAADTSAEGAGGG